MYPIVEQFITIATVGIVILIALAFGQLVLAWWRSRNG